MPTSFRLLAALPALVAVLAFAVPTASAAERVRIDLGRSPAVALDADQTAHIAWLGNEASHASLRYCRLPLGATACDKLISLTAKGDSVSAPFVVVEGSVVKVLQYRYGLSDGLTPDKFAAVFMFTSADGGESFLPAERYVGTLPFADAVAGPGSSVSLVTRARTGGTYYQQVPTDGTSSVKAEILFDKLLPYDGAVGIQDGVPYVVYGDALGEHAMVTHGTGGNLNAPGGWSEPKPITGRVDSARLAGGPSGLFLLGTRADGNLEVRRFDGTTFAAGVTRDDWTGETPQDDLAQDAGGWLHVLLPQITGNCCPLLYSYFDGTRWTSVSYPLPSLPTEVDSAFLGDHRGIAVWYEGNREESTIYALRLGPRAELALPPRSDPPATATAQGGKVMVRVDGALSPPEGVPAADVCAARIVATLHSEGGRKLKAARLRLDDGCTFDGRIRVAKSKAGSGPLKLELKVKKSRTAKPAKRTYKLRVRRG